MPFKYYLYRLRVSVFITRWGSTQSTYIARVPQCLSPRWNWDTPTPSPASDRVPPSPRTKGGTHSPAGEGVGGSLFARHEKAQRSVYSVGFKLKILDKENNIFYFLFC
jgi:hypothetical protein